ncbi:MAG: class I SAM-dependent methyltransferase [Geodermatophilaceae bacterium]|nr:class I SAM-dependent methyltransferase [Geodermatophilaceae bacterium]MDQ3463944.1 cyclopropane-fatty-acyl-phospholipid synthase family protein [Actinomycetota bacterium]
MTAASIFDETPVQQRPALRVVPRPNQGIWPGLAVPPRNAFKARIAQALFGRAVRDLPVRVVYPDGRVVGSGGKHDPVMRLDRPDAFFNRLGSDAKIGFGEAYMVGDWSTGPATDLADLLAPFAGRMARLIHPELQRFRNAVERQQPAEEENTVDQARDNIARHYDLSNDLFAQFLDETMTYSSAWFDDSPGSADSLADAQRRKIDGILDFARVRAGSEVLEIGTGWGGLALRAAQRGARVVTLTLSEEQKTLAERRIAAAGCADRVRVVRQDYREAQGQYDAVISVEMIEAVGMDFWPTYFQSLDRLLAPHGRVGLQSITMPHDRMLATRKSYSWIHKYIFPGGIIPSIPAIEHNLDAHTSLEIVERRDLGPHYAETLRQWRRRFVANWPEVAELGFDETFRRMWEFYLGYCEAGFRVRYLGCSQLSLARSRF